jgi:hypothetical protein
MPAGGGTLKRGATGEFFRAGECLRHGEARASEPGRGPLAPSRVRWRRAGR